MRQLAERIAAWWNEVWFRPASPTGMIAVRFIVAANALWIVLSRPDLPSLASWPRPFWARVDTLLATRYFIGLPASIELVLFVVLIAALFCAMTGIAPRVSCLTAGLLLYHFAPFENIIWHAMGPYFSGLTLPTLALLIFGFAAVPRWSSAWSEEFRWPVLLIEFLLSLNYFGAALSKLHTDGWSWVSAENIRGMAMVSLTWETPPPLASWVAQTPAACWSIAIVTMIAELLFIFVPFSSVAAAVLVPIAFIGHIGIVLVLGIVFLSLPCLLIYLPWDTIDGLVRKHRLLRSAHVL